MKSMKDMKFKTRRKAVSFLDFMIFMAFMVKDFFAMTSGLLVLYAKFRCGVKMLEG